MTKKRRNALYTVILKLKHHPNFPFDFPKPYSDNYEYKKVVKSVEPFKRDPSYTQLLILYVHIYVIRRAVFTKKSLLNIPTMD